MVGWGYAFGRGFVVFLWGIVWAIVGGIIAILVTGSTLIAIISNPTAIATNPQALVGLIGAMFLGIILAVFVAVIGLYATIVKVAVDGALRQMEKSGYRQTPSSYTMATQPTLSFAPTPVVKFCKSCGASLPPGILKCPQCGTNN